jgi:hypothetical protein
MKNYLKKVYKKMPFFIGIAKHKTYYLLAHNKPAIVCIDERICILYSSNIDVNDAITDRLTFFHFSHSHDGWYACKQIHIKERHDQNNNIFCIESIEISHSLIEKVLLNYLKVLHVL